MCNIFLVRIFSFPSPSFSRQREILLARYSLSQSRGYTKCKLTLAISTLVSVGALNVTRGCALTNPSRTLVFLPDPTRERSRNTHAKTTLFWTITGSIREFIVEGGLRTSTWWPGLLDATPQHNATFQMRSRNRTHSRILVVRGETKACELKLRCQPITAAEPT